MLVRIEKNDKILADAAIDATTVEMSHFGPLIADLITLKVKGGTGKTVVINTTLKEGLLIGQSLLDECARVIVKSAS